MKHTKSILFAASCMLQTFVFTHAQNPIITHCYTADPAPMVFEGNDSLYVYCDQDMNIPGVHDYYYMDRWRVYSTVDMVNWTDHGEAMPRSAFSWMKQGTAWASQCVKKGDYYYWFMCCESPKYAWNQIGVGRSKSPSGPFTDFKRSPVVTTGTMGDIDPTVFIDDDGQAYLYYGNNKCQYVKLNSYMINYDTSIGNKGIVTIPMTKETFGGVKHSDGTIDGEDCMEEGPWLDKRGDNYYLIYAAGGIPEHISYSMSKSPEGPWEYKGKIMYDQNTGSFTNHAGIVNYKGRDYFFYHTGWLKGGGGFNRSISVEEFKFNADGTIPEIKATREGVAPIATMSPYLCQQAETMNSGIGVEVVGNESTGVYVTHLHNTDSIRVRNVDFGSEGAQSFTMRFASVQRSGYLMVRLGHAKGKLIGKFKIESTGGESVWEEKSFDLSYIPTGIHDLHFSFVGTPSSEGNTIFNWDWWLFNDAPSAISSVELESGEGQPARWYDLTGRRIITPKSGIYIRNGKKVVVR